MNDLQKLWDEAEKEDLQSLWDEAEKPEQLSYQPKLFKETDLPESSNLLTMAAIGLESLMPEGVKDKLNELNNWISDNTGLLVKLPEGGLAEHEKGRLDEMLNSTDTQFALGAASSALNILKEGYPELEQALEQDSTANTAGKFFDPVLLGIGKVFGKLMPYQKMTGQGFKEGAKAFTKNVSAGGLTGATSSAVSPDSTIEEGATTGATISAVAPAVLGGGAKIYDKVKHVVNPLIGKTHDSVGTVARSVTGDKSDEIADLLQRAKKGQTASQAAYPAKSAEFSALQKVGDSYNPTLASEKYAGQIQNRQDLLQKVKPDLKQSILERSAITSPMRDNALSNATSIKTDAIINQVDQQFSKPGLRTSDVVSDTKSYIIEKLKEWTKKDGTILSDDLYGIRKDIGKIIKSFQKSRGVYDKKAAAGLQRDVQLAIDDAIENAGGTEWKNYLKKYSELSKPIEQSKVVQAMQDTLKGTGGKERREPFMNLVGRGEEQLYKKGTDYPGYKPGDLDEMLTKRQRVVSKIVENQIDRDVAVENLAKKGAPEALRRLRMEEGPPELPNWLNPKITVTKSLLNRLYGMGGEETSKELGRLMLEDPKRLGKIMEELKYPASHKVIDAILSSKQPQALFPLIGE